VKIPRNLASKDLVKALSKLGYDVTRQTGSHIRLTTNKNGKHSLTIPAHNPLRIGTLTSILKDIANHHNLNVNQLIEFLFF
jgi:predicted RNA binding protein YcfA (HicA-like mRNA interferase family)